MKAQYKLSHSTSPFDQPYAPKQCILPQWTRYRVVLTYWFLYWFYIDFCIDWLLILYWFYIDFILILYWLVKPLYSLQPPSRNFLHLSSSNTLPLRHIHTLITINFHNCPSFTTSLHSQSKCVSHRCAQPVSSRLSWSNSVYEHSLRWIHAYPSPRIHNIG